MSDIVVAKVQGSEPDPYTVTFIRRGSNITARCTCKAGLVGQYCRHRMEILAGNLASVVSGNNAEVAQVAGWLPGSDVEIAIRDLADKEAHLEAAKVEVSKSKKRLAKALQD